MLTFFLFFRTFLGWVRFHLREEERLILLSLHFKKCVSFGGFLFSFLETKALDLLSWANLLHANRANADSAKHLLCENVAVKEAGRHKDSRLDVPAGPVPAGSVQP